MTTNITTKNGDDGQTDFAGFRIDKDEIPIRVMVDIDQLNSSLGLARAQTENQLVRDFLHRLQLDTFILAAELATAKRHKASLQDSVDRKFLWYFEKDHEFLSNYKPYAEDFVLPGGMDSVAGAMIDMTRTFARRLECDFSEFCNTVLENEDGVSVSWPQLIWPDVGETSNEDNTSPIKIEFMRQYFNRLSDTLWLLARIEEGTPLLRDGYNCDRFSCSEKIGETVPELRRK